MRKEELTRLNKPYKTSKGEIDRRFNSAIKADSPSSGILAKEILKDLDYTSFGVNWWISLPQQERILISDYLYQSVCAIEVNLVEAKLHYYEFLSAREKINERMADSVFIDSRRELDFKIPPSNKPIDDLPYRLESMHICGFFRAIGSTLDCLGTAIIGVLALPRNLRKGDLSGAKDALTKLKNSGISNIQTDFLTFYENVTKSFNATDWLEWALQNRHMYVHRGRRTTINSMVAREVKLFDPNEQLIPRTNSLTHLPKAPDKSDVEAFIAGLDFCLNEDAETTLSGIFENCREFVETIVEELLNIWKQRRNKPNLIEQPSKQWDDNFKKCNFLGYNKNAQPLGIDLIKGNPILFQRMRAAAIFDGQRNLWTNSKWDKK